LNILQHSPQKKQFFFEISSLFLCEMIYPITNDDWKTKALNIERIARLKTRLSF